MALTQFVPSLLSFIQSPSAVFSAFIIVILLTLTAGRSYCSFICPLGIYQDIIARIPPMLRMKKNTAYTPQHDLLRYSILTVIIVSYSAAGTFLIVWLDPFSIYGRFSSHIVSPAVTGINNSAAVTLSRFNIYSMHSVDIKHAGFGMLFVVVIMIVSISALALFRGRLYCNTVCPVGSLLGLISEISFFKIKINKDTCIHCGKCERICKSSCIEHKYEHVDFSRCVSCFNCLKVCPNSSIKFRPSYSGGVKTEEYTFSREELNPYREKTKISRKNFIAGVVFIPAVLSAQVPGSKRILYVQDRSKQKEYKKNIFISPPGSSGVDMFNKKCTACSLCIARCPSSVLQPAVMQYGIYGIMQPFLDFSTGYCNYDCIVCSEVCPSGAINKITAAEKHQIRTGKSFFIKENCITYTNGTACGACSEHCPTKAVNMVPFKNSLVIPEVNQAICIGCGACEYVCPVRPLKAIYVEGNRLHEKAELPKKEKKIIIEKEDFPF
ncbi:MAG TPA: 4Fe-4S binding protein [Spirochaetota bacterium]|nr:4Fe-4S binding protein [Spirochaetota bacterium]HPS87535.1 4Fe-4S binding protein [Spirochaetota bacterium]